MKIEKLKVVGFEEALRGMRNPLNSWDKADSIIIPNTIPGSGKHIAKQKLYPVKNYAYTPMTEYGDTENDNDYQQDECVSVPVFNTYEVKHYGEKILYHPWLQQYQIINDADEMDEKTLKLFNNNLETSYETVHIGTDNVVLIGENDMNLARRLVSHDNITSNNGGQPNAKFLRDITVSLDLTASFDFWKEFDTYKIGTVANSCSTMHTITKQPITLENFSIADLRVKDVKHISKYIEYLNEVLNDDSITDIEKTRILSKLNLTGFEQKRTIKLDYQVIKNMNVWRYSHKLFEWRYLINLYFKKLPYIQSFFE